ncbi:MAG: hypothetical protein M3O34_18755 [Chloroflexota bacterium]|nr:hypothetical protein [Chloroflexota bacterium]
MTGLPPEMTIIADKDRDTIRDLLARELDAGVELLLFTRPRSRLFVPGRQDCQSCAETQELLQELTGLAAEKLTLTVHDVAAEPSAATRYNVPDVPTVVVRRAEIGAHEGSPHQVGAPAAADGEADPAPVGEGSAPAASEAPANVRFLGLPGGYEFSTLVADIVDVSKGRTDLADATRVAVRAIDSPVHIQVFVTPT